MCLGFANSDHEYHDDYHPQSYQDILSFSLGLRIQDMNKFETWQNKKQTPNTLRHCVWSGHLHHYSIWSPQWL